MRVAVSSRDVAGSCRRQPARARGRLGAQAAMRAAVVVADVFAQNAPRGAFAEDQDVVEAVATERPYQTLAYRVRERRSGRREKASHPEATQPPPVSATASVASLCSLSNARVFARTPPS
jgi:hypothetical protein